MLPALLVLAPLAAAASLPDDPTACFREVATTLSDDSMDGRGVGTAGLEKASTYLAGVFRAGGLRPGARGMRQPFEVVTGVALGTRNALDDGAPRGTGTDWTPAGFSASRAYSGPVVFAGFGISAPELGYDDYAGLDVRGKVVLAMRFEPGENDDSSPFDGKRPTRHSDLRAKAIRAREAGAAALVLVRPPGTAEEPDALAPLKVQGPLSDAGIPVLHVTRATADRWLAGTGKTTAQLRDAIDASGKPASTALDLRVRGRTDVIPTRATTWNIVGVVPGRGALAGEQVVLGAHYDHLGHGGAGSLRPGTDAIHNGADDNASGVAAAVCAAADLARRPAAGERRTLVVLAFSAEEVGLGGSAAWVGRPAVGTLATTAAMVNLDMVGRVRDGALQVLGAESAPEWRTRVTTAGAAAPTLRITAGGDGYGPSDHTSFYAEGVPVVHLFSGAHAEYHTPDDDADTLNMEGGGAVVRFTARLVDDLLAQPERLTWARSATGAPGGDSRGYGAYFGSIPDYTAMEATRGGVKLADTRPGSPAERAGLRRGDVIVRMAGTSVQNLHDMTFVLRDHRPGETVDVVVEREGKPLALQATLASRTADAGGAPHGGGANPHGASRGAGAPEGGRGPGVTGHAAGPIKVPSEDVSALVRPDEVHFDGLRRLTFGGDNAEAYWAPDGKRLILQITPRDGTSCDQEYVYDLTAETLTRVSSGLGRTTCGTFDYPRGDTLLYATTEAAGAACPAKPDHSQGYVWPVYDSFDIVRRDASGTTTPWNPAPGYDAEATVCMKDGRVVFTSTRDGDLELYVANADGSGLRRLTHTPGYDGGAFFTPDCATIVWRASRPGGEALAEYQRLLKQGLVRPTSLDLFAANADGTNARQLTFDGKGSFAPYPTPDGKGVLYSSNRGADPREFDLWYVPWEGGVPTRVTSAPGFDGFPMFSPDGQWLVFSSNRANAAGGRDTDVYLTRWRP